jgi:ATP-dependent DNA helicase RecG
VLETTRAVIPVFPKESESVELKEMVTADLKKSTLAFANSGGGTLYVGVTDSGEITGLPDADADLMNINNMLRDGIKPDITLFVHSKIEQINGKSVIKMSIQGGTERPYYLAGKGIRPGGVYVRHGAATVPATDTAIRKMIRDTDGESYEKLRSTEQELTFLSAEAEFLQRNTAFGDPQSATLGLMNADKIYTNLALLLSEQCPHTIKAAAFQEPQTFKDRREFGGSLFTQLNEAYRYLDLNNKTEATFDKLLRIDRRDYPETALREALLNAVVHREYAASGSILIKIFPDRIEFISPGGLISGIEVEDIMSGYSACRNPNLAAVFYRLQLIEAYGTGILKILDAYKASRVLPKIEVTPNVFKMTLPNWNAAPVQISERASAANYAPGYRLSPGGVAAPRAHYEARAQDVPPEEHIRLFVLERGSITRKQAEMLLGVSQTSAGVVLRAMSERGEIERKGNSRNARYFARE